MILKIGDVVQINFYNNSESQNPSKIEFGVIVSKRGKTLKGEYCSNKTNGKYNMFELQEDHHYNDWKGRPVIAKVGEQIKK